MSANGSGPPRQGRRQTPPPPSSSVTSQSTAGVRQDSDDALFGVAGRSYADSTSWRLPDDEDERTGPERKQTGQRSAWGRTDTGWRTKALAVVATLAASGQTFTSDDVRVLVDDNAISQQAWGALLGGCARRGWIVRVGFVQSGRAERHGAHVAQWRGRR